jgi:iduronate 2-sulfatase
MELIRAIRNGDDARSHIRLAARRKGTRTNWETATRVPMILCVPNHPATSAGKGTTALVGFIDVCPTLVEFCGLPMPPKLEGRSMAPLLDEPAATWKSAAFSVYEKNVLELGGRTLGRAMRTDRYRLIEWSGKDGAKRVYELYDHASDPQENTNIADRAEHRPLLEELVKQLHRAM